MLKFAGIDSINDAETLRGMEVAIPREERAPLSDDEVYVSELVGCHVYTGEAQEDIGEITDVDFESTAMPLLVVKRTRGDEVLIPFAKAFLNRMDVAAKRVEMTLPEGLLDVNAPTDRRGAPRAAAGSRRRRSREPIAKPVIPADVPA